MHMRDIEGMEYEQIAEIHGIECQCGQGEPFPGQEKSQGYDIKNTRI